MSKMYHILVSVGETLKLNKILPNYYFGYSFEGGYLLKKFISSKIQFWKWRSRIFYSRFWARFFYCKSWFSSIKGSWRWASNRLDLEGKYTLEIHSKNFREVINWLWFCILCPLILHFSITSILNLSYKKGWRLQFTFTMLTISRWNIFIFQSKVILLCFFPKEIHITYNLRLYILNLNYFDRTHQNFDLLPNLKETQRISK